MASGCSWFFVLVWLWWLPLAVAAEEQKQGVDCPATARCGNLTISDPFWLTDLQTGRSCGSPDVELTCLYKTLIMRGHGVTGFLIINITYEDRSLRAIDGGKLQLLNVSDSCDFAPNWNTSAKLGRPFRISPVNLNLVMYICSTAAAVVAACQDSALLRTRIRCRNEREVFVRAGGLHNDTGDYDVGGCEAIIVPVLGGANGEADASDYERLISQGFLLTWDGPTHDRGRSIQQKPLVVTAAIPNLDLRCLPAPVYRFWSGFSGFC
ncbi:hypothetical protein ACQ4PT_056710 [Festuca glaucescens]